MDGWAVAHYNEAKSLNLIPTDDVLGSDYAAKITLAQFAALAVTTHKKVTKTTVPVSASDDTFADSKDNQYMAEACNLGILSGCNSADTRADVYVGLHDPITREQAATMLVRLMIKYYDDTGGEPALHGRRVQLGARRHRRRLCQRHYDMHQCHHLRR